MVTLIELKKEKTDLDELIDSLIAADRAERLKGSDEQ